MSYIFSRMKIRSRLLIAIIVPVLVTALTGGFLTASQMSKNGQAEIKQLEQKLLNSRKESLQDIVHSVQSIAEEAKASGGYSGDELEEAVRNRIRSVEYGNKNYIFAYKKIPAPNYYENMAYRPDLTKEGPLAASATKVQNLIEDIFKAARTDGFHEYTWPNPATGQEEPKISYAIILDDLGWMIGTGVYTNDVSDIVAEAKAKLEEDINSAILIVASISGLVVIIAIIFGLFVGNTVTRPLRNAIDMMSEIANGEGDLTQRLPDNGSDELSELGARFNDFVAKIQETVRKVGETTYQVASAAEELSHVAQETSGSVEKQGAETDQIASAINEMAATINEISKSASEVQSHGADADRLSKESGKTMKASQGVVSDLSENILESSKVIENLASRTNEIQSVLDVIHEVTDQTNLLALNAAIEAARAGEHGRGFAVVADEVRQLARRSDESASQIREMIEGFITESEKAVEKMRSSQGLTDQTVERIDHATTTLETITRSVESIHDQITQIAAGSEQQSQVAEEINKNIVRIVEASQSSQTGVTQTQQSSGELARLSEELRSLVDQFKT